LQLQQATYKELGDTQWAHVAQLRNVVGESVLEVVHADLLDISQLFYNEITVITTAMVASSKIALAYSFRNKTTLEY
jgi:hypothetical protein